MILIHGDEAHKQPAQGEPGFDEMARAWAAYNQQLIDGGHWISGAMLAPTSTATTVRKSFNGAPAIVDGPSAETAEQLGGYYLVSAKDLDEAIALATDIPVPVGSIEVRPIALLANAVLVR